MKTVPAEEVKSVIKDLLIEKFGAIAKAEMITSQCESVPSSEAEIWDELHTKRQRLWILSGSMSTPINISRTKRLFVNNWPTTG